MFCQFNKCNSKNLPKSPPTPRPVSMSGNILGSLSVRILTLRGVTKAEKGWEQRVQGQEARVRLILPCTASANPHLLMVGSIPTGTQSLGLSIPSCDSTY